MNNELNRNIKPESWSKSKTIMLPKSKKPTAVQLRPIALTDSSYKIFMALIKSRVEKHLCNNELYNDMQAGFTEKRRIEDNLFMLHECKEMSFRKKKQLIVISIDYTKAYDSINRKEIVETLKYYKIDKAIINSIVHIYSHDTTTMKLREGLEINFDISSGIRQGCTLSSTIFKMITYRIMEEIERLCKGVIMEDKKINSLFYADDGLILADNKEEAEKNINIVSKISKKYGLEINIDKSKVIIFNKKENIEKIGNIKVENSFEYLGIQIIDKRNMFQDHIKKSLTKAKKFENMTFSMIEQSCNRVLVGKVFYKNICLPAILYGLNIVKINEKEINNLQTIENNVYRKILDAASYTPIGTLRGEIGSSSMKSRIYKGKILYWKSIMERNNDLLKAIINQSHCHLNNEIEKYLRVLGITQAEIKYKNREWIKEKVRQWDEDMWREENLKKSTLFIYNENKKKIKEVSYYNDKKSLFIFKIKTNTLKLNDRNRHINEEIKCSLCNYTCEDLEHFLLECPKLEKERNAIIKLQRPREENTLKIIGELVFDNDEINESKIYNLWLKRRLLLNEIINNK